MKRLIKKHPLAMRWFHWVNFPLLALMIISGLLIYWANPVYSLGPIPLNLDQAHWRTLQMNNRLAMGMAWHFFFMWLFGINGFLYVVYTVTSGEWRHLVPDRRSLREAFQVLLHDLHLREGAPPQGKYNAAQRIAYSAVVVMGFFSLLTGLAIYKPVQFSWIAALFGGYQWSRFFHFWITAGYLVFFVIHIAQVIRAGWNNFRAMIIGREVIHE